MGRSYTPKPLPPPSQFDRESVGARGNAGSEVTHAIADVNTWATQRAPRAFTFVPFTGESTTRRWWLELKQHAHSHARARHSTYTPKAVVPREPLRPATECRRSAPFDGTTTAQVWPRCCLNAARARALNAGQSAYSRPYAPPAQDPAHDTSRWTVSLPEDRDFVSENHRAFTPKLKPRCEAATLPPSHARQTGPHAFYVKRDAQHYEPISHLMQF